MREPTAAEMPDWPDEIFAALKAARIHQVGYVPDAGHARLIELCRDDPEIRTVPLTTEEEGVALAAGAWLGGQRAALLMQSSGVGNCINMLSLTKTCRFPLMMLVAMRGDRAGGRWRSLHPPFCADQPLRQQNRRGEVAVERDLEPRGDGLGGLLGPFDAIDQHVAQFERRLCI